MTLSLASVLAESARRFGDRTAVIDAQHRITYADLWRAALRFAAVLQSGGVRPGDRVALVAPNTAEFPIAYFGILATGAVVVPVHLLFTAPDVGHVLHDSGTTTVVYHPVIGQLATAAAAMVEATAVPVLAADLLGGPTGDGAAPALVRHADRAADDPAVILYTSGTTGRPKGAVLTHLNLVMNATVSAFDCHDTRPDDVVLGCLPLFHSYGQTAAMNAAFRRGATLVLQARFDPVGAIELMRAERVDVFLGVPTMYVALCEAARDLAELPALRVCVSGGASLPEPLLVEFERIFQTQVFEGYGLSETSPVATANNVAFGRRPGTVGHPIWGVDVEIARADLFDRIELLPVGELGEVVIRGHNVFAGYLNQPAATAEVLVDGWLRTGDLGLKDADGYLSVVDRKKDVIIRGGFNVYPREVEDALLRHPAVGQVAVVGLPDQRYGEEVCAVVVPVDRSATDPDEIIAWAREHVGRHGYPRRIELVEALPMGPSMKVLKRELRRMLAEGGTR